MDDYEDSEDEMWDGCEPDDIMEGGDIQDNNQENVQESEESIINSNIVITNNSIDVHKPVITRKIMSIYEFVGVITKLADYLYHLDDLTGIIEDKEVYTYINHLELAWILLRDRKFDAILNRYVEQVNFSELDINPHWIKLIEANFKSHSQSFEDDILKPLQLYM
jgi:hypothetical protein